MRSRGVPVGKEVEGADESKDSEEQEEAVRVTKRSTKRLDKGKKKEMNLSWERICTN